VSNYIPQEGVIILLGPYLACERNPPCQRTLPTGSDPAGSYLSPPAGFVPPLFAPPSRREKGRFFRIFFETQNEYLSFCFSSAKMQAGLIFLPAGHSIELAGLSR
jgi:hypothetical protein